jgi:uncharacterized protein (DUF362 family)
MIDIIGRLNGQTHPTGSETTAPGAGPAVTGHAMAQVFLSGVSKDSSEQALRRAVRDAAEAATDFSWLSSGDSVFIKLALNSGYPYPSTTNPVAVAAMVGLLKDKGAGRIVVGDMSGIMYLKLTPRSVWGSTRSLMERNGMAHAVHEAGADLYCFEEAGWDAFFEDAPVAGSHWTAGLMMPSILKKMDHLVLMPRCANHILAGSTLGLKAAVGYWRTDTRLEYHRDASTLQEKTADANTVGVLRDKQRLVVSAATKLLTTFGPDEGFVMEPQTGLVIASRSVVAHDMVSLAWLLLCRTQTPASTFQWLTDRSGVVADLSNRYIVTKLGGVSAALYAQRLIKNQVLSIWDDRILNRAYEVFGGTPVVTLQAVDEVVPVEVKQRLAGMTSPVS